MKKIKLLLLSIIDYFRHLKSYSQDGEDIVLFSFYEDSKKKDGFYVDIGAHHPVRFSNTWFFYKKGWRGINIDPTPGSMRMFNVFRRNDINIEVGVGLEYGVQILNCFNEPALNTFDANLARERNTGKPYKLIKTVKITIEPLSSILEKHLPAGKQIDFLTIDVEGLDLDVLNSNNWKKFKPKYILVEDLFFNPSSPENSEIYQVLTNKGYHIVAVLKRTLIFKINIAPD